MRFPASLLFLVFILYSCQSSETIETAADSTSLYHEPHRPQFHFSPPEKWMNDPNGMVYYEGEYHLFYQYHPYSTVWGPMHWGHAVSPDLVHWENLPIALYPDSLGTIFSGSAVIDWKNTSGFGTAEQPPLVAIFTYHDSLGAQAGRSDFQTQGIAYSIDRGRSWTKYDGNPALPNRSGIHDFRDPKVFWHEPSGRWVMILAVKDRVHFYNSPNLREWSFASEFGVDQGSHGGVWECPDLFELPIEGATESRWVLLLSINPGGPNGGSATQYFVGAFDGKNFTPDHDLPEEHAHWVDFGRDNYAGVTWSDVPAADGRRLFLGWMSNWDYARDVPTTAWRSAMTIPRSLRLANTAEGPHLFSQPVRELEKLRGKNASLPEQPVENTVDMTESLTFSPTISELILEFELPVEGSPDLGVELSNQRGERYRIGYDAGRRQFYSDRTGAGQTSFSDNFAPGKSYAPRFIDSRSLRLHIFFDVASAELFADNGATVLTEIFFPNEDFDQIKLFSENGRAILKEGQVFELQSIWK